MHLPTFPKTATAGLPQARMLSLAFTGVWAAITVFNLITAGGQWSWLTILMVVITLVYAARTVFLHLEITRREENDGVQGHERH